MMTSYPMLIRLFRGAAISAAPADERDLILHVRQGAIERRAAGAADLEVLAALRRALGTATVPAECEAQAIVLRARIVREVVTVFCDAGA